ncbi:restriction endonuclease subunit S [Microbulbifer sp. ZKSA002]|uniref:restriction endonuclease subunit S n=1 Tax=Microbulbifer sp. ZKSA002 TaxID=3243388 RepID=UPI004039296C
MSDWPVVTIEEITSKDKYSCVGGPFGSSLSRKHYVEEEAVPVIRGTNLNGDKFIDEGFVYVSEEKGDQLHRNMAYPGEIVFTQRGTLGQVAIIPRNVKHERYVVSQSQMKLKVDDSLADPYYVYSFFRTQKAKAEIENRAIIGGVPHINLGILKAFEIPLPPLNIQKDIAKKIKDLDKKIELNRQTNQTLEQIAQALFKSWFVDFEPTRAKIAANQAAQLRQQGQSDSEIVNKIQQDPRWSSAQAAIIAQGNPEQAAIAALNGGQTFDTLSEAQQNQLQTTAALFPDTLVDSELGDIPKNWEVKPLSKVIELIGGGTPKKSEASYWNGNIPWFSVKDAPANADVFVIDTELKITELGLKKSSTKLLPEGVTIISARGTVGRLALVGTPTAMNQSCYGVKGTEGFGPYLNYFNLKQAVSTLQQNTHGAVFDTITRVTFDTVFIVDSHEEIKAAFEKVVADSFEKIKTNLFENGILENLRDKLLPKLLSGK